MLIFFLYESSDYNREERREAGVQTGDKGNVGGFFSFITGARQGWNIRKKLRKKTNDGIK